VGVVHGVQQLLLAGVNDERLVDFGRVGLGADVALEVVGVTVDRPPVELPAPAMAE